MANSRSKVKVKGTFHCKVYDNGVLIQEITERNMVVQAGLDHITKLLTGETITFPLQKIGVGSGTSAPALGDTNLTPSKFARDFNSIDFVAGNALIEWQIDPGEANGITITEFGLCFSNETLFARKTGVSIAKSGTVSMVGTWTIEMT